MKKLMILTMMMTSLLSFAGHGKNLVDIAIANGNFKTLITALEISGLDQVVRDSKNITIFAPTDDAFAKIPTDTLNAILADQELLKSVLLYHVAKPALKAKVVLKLNGIKTLSGKYITNNSTADRAILNKSGIIATDIVGGNGIIHVIDTVMVPTEMTANNEIQTVASVDLEKYMGLWYELYRFPNSFEKGCFDVTAEYRLKRNGKVAVANTCIKSTGSKKVGHGTAKVVNRKTNASLKVSFVPFLQRWALFGGDYNILALGENYEYALVGSKDRSYLWILSRTKELDEGTISHIKNIAITQGYNVSKFIKTPTLE